MKKIKSEMHQKNEIRHFKIWRLYLVKRRRLFEKQRFYTFWGLKTE